MDSEIFASSFMLAVVLGGPLRFKLFPQDLFQFNPKILAFYF
jgi:hypothetical protein